MTRCRSGGDVIEKEQATAEEQLEIVDEGHVLERTSRVLAVLPNPEGIDADIEISFRQSTVVARQAKQTITICEVCVTKIDPDGTRTSVCKPIKCPEEPRRPRPRPV